MTFIQKVCRNVVETNILRTDGRTNGIPLLLSFIRKNMDRRYLHLKDIRQYMESASAGINKHGPPTSMVSEINVMRQCHTLK